jgi:hypothetical protein
MEVPILPAMDTDLLEPPANLERAEQIAIDAAHNYLHLPPGVKRDEEAEVVFTGPKRAIVYLALRVEVELP